MVSRRALLRTARACALLGGSARRVVALPRSSRSDDSARLGVQSRGRSARSSMGRSLPRAGPLHPARSEEWPRVRALELEKARHARGGDRPVLFGGSLRWLEDRPVGSSADSCARCPTARTFVDLAPTRWVEATRSARGRRAPIGDTPVAQTGARAHRRRLRPAELPIGPASPKRAHTSSRYGFARRVAPPGGRNRAGLAYRRLRSVRTARALVTRCAVRSRRATRARRARCTSRR
jgi:hypothetical protein